jgi:hypothetical protein
MHSEKNHTVRSIEDQVELATRQRLAEIGARARRRLGELAGQFARAEGIERERLLAEIEFERWLADGCEDDLL